MEEISEEECLSLLEQNTLGRIAVVVSEQAIPPGVDTPQDLEAVRKMLT